MLEVKAPFGDDVVDRIKRTTEADGYVILRGVVSPEASLRCGEAIFREYERLTTAGWTFTGGGHLEGHLNISPGEAARELLDEAAAVDLAGLVSRVGGVPVHLTAIAGNLCMPGNHPQNFHPDGPTTDKWWLANIALVPTTAHNGAMELVPGTQNFGDSYGKFWKAGLTRRGEQPSMEPGDVLLRLSSAWHRGTRNHSSRARPLGMLGFRPVSEGAPSFKLSPGEPLTIRSNRYYGKMAALREWSAIRLRPFYEAARIFTSFRR